MRDLNRVVGLWVCASLGVISVNAAEPAARAKAGKIAVPPLVRAELEQGVEKLGQQIAELRTALKDKPDLRGLLPDVEIFHKAVQWPLLYSEFYRSNEFGIARTLLKQGGERARALRDGQAPWLTATGLVVRAYTSKIDGSIQPYGLVVPASFRKEASRRHRLDVWLHGRDDSLTELKFISDRQRSVGEFAPTDAFVLHPYGRYCNAFKFAGEVDVFEAMEHVKRNYGIDPNRIAIRGFSMGGAGGWHLAVHHPGVWAAANPGAGFVETAEYTKALLKEPKPAWFEQSLWHLYDSVDYAGNIFNCPTVAYSGEIDPQKRAADLMAIATKREGLELTHIIGPNTPHKYEPEAKKEVARRVDELVGRGRDALPREVRFTTWTLRYNTCKWVSIDQMEKHWERARVDAFIDAPNHLSIHTTNVTQLTLSFPREGGPLDAKQVKVKIDDQTLAASLSASDDLRQIQLRRIVNSFPHGRPYSWTTGPVTQNANSPDLWLKNHDRQGPIDDAFTDAFIFVRPTGQALNPDVGKWIEHELEQATNAWRAQFRGDVRVKNDTEITTREIAEANLILWGDPQSNKLLERIANKLPLAWNAKEIRFDAKTYDSAEHVPVLIYPNPLNPNRYVVLNSGFTFAGVFGASNAQQTPKLPDYALLKLAANAHSSIVQAGFFDEAWHFKNASQQ
jgi:hypothetical protein